MLKNSNPMKQLVLVLVLAGGFAAFGADKPSLRAGKERAIEVVKINPSKADLRKIHLKRQREGADQAQEAEVYLVKLHVNMPPPRAEGHVLYIGDTKVDAYGPFAEGIFFKIYEGKEVAAMRGKPMRFALKGEVTELGTSFPAPDQSAPGRLPELREALRSK